MYGNLLGQTQHWLSYRCGHISRFDCKILFTDKLLGEYILSLLVSIFRGKEDFLNPNYYGHSQKCCTHADIWKNDKKNFNRMKYIEGSFVKSSGKNSREH